VIPKAGCSRPRARCQAFQNTAWEPSHEPANRLFVQAAYQSMLLILSESERDFFLKAVDAQITFVTDAQGRMTELVFTKVRNVTRSESSSAPQFRLRIRLGSLQLHRSSALSSWMYSGKGRRMRGMGSTLKEIPRGSQFFRSHLKNGITGRLGPEKRVKPGKSEAMWKTLHIFEMASSYQHAPGSPRPVPNRKTDKLAFYDHDCIGSESLVILPTIFANYL
jgi:hypothetical protein